MTKEILEKVKKCNSVDEVIKMAKENNINVKREDAESIFKQTHQVEGKISDEELNNVSGGANQNGCAKGRHPYKKILWKNRKDVQFLFKPGDIIEVYVSTFLDWGGSTRTAIVSRCLEDCLNVDDGWWDKYKCELYNRDDGTITERQFFYADREDIEMQ